MQIKVCQRWCIFFNYFKKNHGLIKQFEYNYQIKK